MLEKLEKVTFLILVFSIPFQKRFFLFGPAPEGERFFEWGSGFLYATDILVLILFSFWLFSRLVEIKLQPKTLRRRRVERSVGVFLIAFLGFALVSLAQAEFVDVGVYRFFKLAEFIFLFFYVTYHVGFTKSHIKQVLWVFVASGVFQSIIAILQFAKQSSLGLEIFHESILKIGLKGVAEINAGGVEFIRAYGTFPSPNVLAGFLGICLIFAFYLFVREEKRKQSVQRTQDLHIVRSYVMSTSVFLLSLGLILTFSRGTIIFFGFTTLLFFAGIFFMKRFGEFKKPARRLAGLVVVSWLLIVAALWPEVSSRFLESSLGEPAIQERLFFNEVGIDAVRQNYTQLFFGVGIGNFVQHYMRFLPGLAPHLYQPVHNIFILVASEIGILGLLAFLSFLAVIGSRAIIKFFKQTNFSYLLLYILILNSLFLILIGAYDHYLWTLQQGGLMFWLSFGLLASAANDYNKKP